MVTDATPYVKYSHLFSYQLGFTNSVFFSESLTCSSNKLIFWFNKSTSTVFSESIVLRESSCICNSLILFDIFTASSSVKVTCDNPTENN